MAHCTTANCSSVGLTTLDSAGSVGSYTSVAIGADGFPVISYYDANNNRDLKVAHCTDVACTSTVDVTTLDSDGSVGLLTSVAIGTDGFPVISYYDAGNSDLKVAHCRAVGCNNHFFP